MKRFIIIITCFICLIGCSTTSPFIKQYEEIDTLYNTNQLPTIEYIKAKRTLIQQEILSGYDANNSFSQLYSNLETIYKSGKITAVQYIETKQSIQQDEIAYKQQKQKESINAMNSIRESCKKISEDQEKERKYQNEMEMHKFEAIMNSRGNNQPIKVRVVD